MPEIISNQATVNYQYNDTTRSSTSNPVSTTINEQYAITARKLSLVDTFRPESLVTYVTEFTNSGIGDVYDLTLSDNLGNGNLEYVTDSLRVYLNGSLVENITPIASTTLSFTIPGVIRPGDSLQIFYIGKVKANISPTTTTITNTQTIEVAQGSSSGTKLRVTPNPSATVTLEDFASVSISKFVDKDTIVAGDDLTYSFTLTNDGNINATNVILTDVLPTKFTITSIRVETDGTVVNYPAGTYTLDPATNKLTLPANSGNPIVVLPNKPTIVTIVGRINA